MLTRSLIALTLSKSSRRTTAWVLGAGLLAATISIARLNAQGTTATIQGTVTDSSGAAVPDATVQARNVGTGSIQSTVTNQVGRFNLADLGVGEYEVQAAKMGFSTVVHKSVTLTVGGQSLVDFSLPVGQQTQTVTVEGQVSQVETTNATVGSYTSEQQMRELPLNGRNFEQLILLAPGVQQITAFTVSGLQGRANEYSIGGSRPEGQVILLDDENLQNFWNKGIGSVTGSSLGVEAIGEFQTLTNTYSAQFGGNGGAINSVSKSGTNSFHGSAYDFLRNSALDARRFIDPSTIPPFRKNQFGGSLGGPIKKDKAFFFVNYEGLRQLLGETNVATVPACNVPNVCTPTFPRATNPTAYDGIVNTLALFPFPDPGTVSGTIGRATLVANQIAHEDYVLARVDYNLSQKDSLFVRYISDKAYFLEPFGGGASIGGGFVPFWPETDTSYSQFTTLEWRRIVTPTLVNLARASFSRPSTVGVTSSSTPPLQFYPNHARQDGLITIAGLSGIGGSSGLPFNLTPDTYTVADDVIWNHGSHSIRFGGAVARVQSNVYFPYRGGSAWSFQGLASFLGGGVTTGTGVSTLTYVPLILPNGQPSYGHRDFRYTQIMPYIQDDWKVSSKLTVNLGLRWEFMTNATEKHDQLNVVTDYRHATGFSHVSNVTQTNPNWTNLAPRIGIAYDPFADHKTSIRAGFGMFYQPYVPADYGTGGYASNPPWSIFAAGLSVPGSGVPIYPNVPTNLTSTIPSGVQGWNWDNSKTPYVIQYNFNIQRQLTGSTILTVGYVGSRGVHILGLAEQNPSSIINGVAGNLNASGSSVVDNPRLNRSLGSFANLIPTSSHRYNSLQASLVHRFSHNVQAQASYTYSKCLDNGNYLGSFGSNAPGGWGNPYSQRYDWGLCPYDITHVFTLNGLYALPLHGNRAVEGWQFSGVVSASTGPPFTILDGIDATGFGSNLSRPNVNPGFTNNPVLGTPTQWFNPAAFSMAPIGTLGNIGRDTVRGPKFNNTDIALLKDTKLTERVRVQFRAEFFNVLNHTNYRVPSNSVGTILYTGLANGKPIPNPNAGRITNIVGTPRQIQFALKFLF